MRTVRLTIWTALSCLSLASGCRPAAPPPAPVAPPPAVVPAPPPAAVEVARVADDAGATPPGPVGTARELEPADGGVVLRDRPGAAPESMELLITLGPSPAPRVRTLLELGDSVAEVLALDAAGFAPGAELRVEQRVETSLTVQDEGPHLDLDGWRHGYTPWQVLEAAGPGRFRRPALEFAEGEKPFPKTTRAEVADALRGAYPQEVNEAWLSKRGAAGTPFDAKAFVGTSAIELRVSVKQGGAFVPVTTVVFVVPMGC